MSVETSGQPETVWRAHMTSDPRAGDYPDDSLLWLRLLTAAYDRDGGHPEGLFGALSGIRGLGARLESTPNGTRITAGEIDAAEYGEIRERWLLPHTDVLVELLRGIS